MKIRRASEGDQAVLRELIEEFNAEIPEPEMVVPSFEAPPRGRIVKQTPRWGVKRARGARVSLVVSRGKR